MSLQVGCIHLATEPGVTGSITDQHATTAQAIETLLIRTRPPAQKTPYHFAEVGVAREGNQDAAQMIAEQPFITVCLSFQGGEVEAALPSLMETAMHDIRLPTHQPE